MDRNRLWIIGAVLVMAVIVGAGWIVGVQPQLDAASAADSQRAMVDATNERYSAQLTTLQADYKKLPDLKAELADLNKSIPTGSAIPDLVSEFNGLAAATGVTVTGMTVSDALPYTTVVAPSVAAQTPTSTSTSTPSPTPTPTPAASAAPAAPQAGVPPVTSPLITPQNFAAIPVDVSVSGPYSNVLDFLHGVQTGDRLFLVTGLSTTPAAAGAGVDGKVSGLIYVLVSSAPAAATK